MKKILLVLITLFLNANVLAFDSSTLSLPIIGITDGDTIKSELRMLPHPLSKVSIRLLNIDTPESTKRWSKCYNEMYMGIAVKRYVKSRFKHASYMYISNYKWDKYGGRIDADVYIDDVNVAKDLLAKGYAVEYDGRKKTKDWCSTAIPESLLYYMTK